MAKNLVIVESPAKAKTIQKYLGKDFEVKSSFGHIRDLPKKGMGINLENFTPDYEISADKKKVVAELKAASKKAETVWLASDEDREGEAIAWHLAQELKLKSENTKRIVFHEITKKAILKAVENPREIDQNLVNAQQARRVLDRLVGYQISPLLWRKVRKGLSAGRVQSAALKIICDREKEIRSFVPEEYWTITAEFNKKKNFTAKLSYKNGKKIKISSKEENDKILEELSYNKYSVSKIIEKPRVKKPYAPFTTSSMQQDAANKLNFNTRKTMVVAQQLYEGIDVGKRGTMGLPM